jgi:hypothetical protein
LTATVIALNPPMQLPETYCAFWTTGVLATCCEKPAETRFVDPGIAWSIATVPIIGGELPEDRLLGGVPSPVRTESVVVEPAVMPAI